MKKYNKPNFNKILLETEGSFLASSVIETEEKEFKVETYTHEVEDDWYSTMPTKFN